MKKYIVGLLGAVMTVSTLGASAALAAPYQYNFTVNPDIGSPYTEAIDAPSDSTYCYMFGIDPSTHTPRLFRPNAGLSCTGSALNVDAIDQTNITGLTESLANKASTSTTNTLSAQISSNSSAIGVLQTAMATMSPIQRTRVTTDASGNYTWTFPTAYATSTMPVVSVVAEDATSAFSNVQITAISRTSVTVHAGKITSALGILSLASNASIPIDLIAVAQ